jgi:hypothetical protein
MPGRNLHMDLQIFLPDFWCSSGYGDSIWRALKSCKTGYFIWIVLEMRFFETISRILASLVIPSGRKLVFSLKWAQSLFKTGQNSKKYTESHWKMQEYISESIEPPTNPQFLNSSGHVKWSLHNLRNIRNRGEISGDPCVGSFLASPGAHLSPSEF